MYHIVYASQLWYFQIIFSSYLEKFKLLKIYFYTSEGLQILLYRKNKGNPNSDSQFGPKLLG